MLLFLAIKIFFVGREIISNIDYLGERPSFVSLGELTSEHLEAVWQEIFSVYNAIPYIRSPCLVIRRIQRYRPEKSLECC